MTGEILFSIETDSWKLAVEAAVKAKTNLEGANLAGANLEGANLDRANLARANLKGANLDGARLDRANLVAANLHRANLDGARLYQANLYQANLEGANLDGADLYHANLCQANLYRANLYQAALCQANLYRANLDEANLYQANVEGANLNGANLDYFRDDFWAVLSAAPQEVSGLRKAIVEGKICGEDARLVETIANGHGKKYQDLGLFEKYNVWRPIECFFQGIYEDDTPETNEFSKAVLKWLDEWVVNVSAAFTVTATDAKKDGPDF